MKKYLRLGFLLIISFLTFSLNAQVSDLSENFDNPVLPAGWEVQNIGVQNQWYISNSSTAGGSAYELVCNYQSGFGTTRMISPAINTLGLSSLELSFKHMFDDWGAGMSITIQTSTDKVNWITEPSWQIISGNGNKGPESINAFLLYNLNSTTTYISFVLTGNLYNFDNWHVDDIYTISSLSTPSLHISKPDNGSFWYSGLQREINWTSINIPFPYVVNIEYSLNGGTTWETIASDILTSNGNNSYFWNIPFIPGLNSNSLLRIKTPGDEYIGTSDGFTLSETPQFTFQTPTSGTIWNAGNTYEVVINNAGAYTYVNGVINISTNSGESWNPLIYLPELYPGLNSLTISLDEFIESSEFCRLAFFPYNENSENSFESSLFQTQAAPASLTLNRPDGNSFFQSGTYQQIRWTSVNLTQDITIQYSLDGGSTWSDILTTYAANGDYSYGWLVPSVAGNTSALVRVATIDFSFSSMSNPFIISFNPQYSFNSPFSAEVLTAGGTYTIEINNSGPSTLPGSQLYLYLSLSGGSGLDQHIASIDVPNGVSQYSWTIEPTISTNNAAIVLYDPYEGGHLVQSGIFTILPAPPSISVTSPTSGSFWKSGRDYYIEWSSVNMTQNVNIDYSLDGVSWTNIVMDYPTYNGDNAYLWNVDSVSGYYVNSMVRITNSGPVPTVEATSNLFTISETSQLVFTQPAGGAGITQWVSSQTYEILLNNIGPDLNTTQSNVYLSTDGGINWNHYLFSIYDNIANGLSQYSWTIEPNMVTNQAKLFVYDINTGLVLAESPIFEILPPPATITVHQPAAGTFWKSGKKTYVEWTANNVTSLVNIEYSLDGGVSWNISATDINTAQGYNYYWWTIPNVAGVNPGSRVRVISSDGTVFGTSEIFTISEYPQFEIIEPAAGDSWLKGSTYPIRINNQGEYANISGYIFLSTDGGNSWNYLIYVQELYPGVNIFNWNIEGYWTSSANCQLAISPGGGYDPNWQYFSLSNPFSLYDFVPVSQISILPEGGATSIDTEGGTLQMNISVLPASATNQYVHWSVADVTGRATISQSGLLTAYLDGTVTVTATATDGSNVTADQQITISNQIISPEDKNIIKNGGFDIDGTILPDSDPWQSWTMNSGTAEVIGGVCKMVPAAIGQIWENQVFQRGWSVSNGSSYTLTFTAWADADRSIEISLEDFNSSYVRIGYSSDPEALFGRSDWLVPLTTTPTTFTLHFTVDSQHLNSLNSIILMNANELPAAYFDDISIVNDIFGPASISISNPAEGSFWQSGFEQYIEWNSVNVYQNVNLQFSTDGGISWTNIDAIYPVNGINSYLWNVAEVSGLNDNSQIRVISEDATVEGVSNIFTILGSNAFAGGSGTEANPYLIANADHLNNVRLFLGAANANIYFLQTADIDLGVSPWNAGEGWAPIGIVGNAFYGKYNGNGYTISGLTINRPATNMIGLFGVTTGASITNLGLLNVDITGYLGVGALAGLAQHNTYIGNCYSTGIVKGEVVLGGLLGRLYYGSILENSYSTVNVQMIPGVSNQQAAGLVGRVRFNGIIKNCFATGNVEGLSAWAGGLVAILSDGEITNCYATGDVSGDNYVGGLIGLQELGNLTNCYSAGNVIFSAQGGGLVGNSTGVGESFNSFWNTETSGQSASAKGEGRNTLQMVNSSTFTGWDFGITWNIDESLSYPYLIMQGSPMAFNYPPDNLPPSGLSALAGDGTVSLTWNAPSIGSPTSYQVYRDGGLYSTVAAGITDFTDNSVTNYVTYTYNVSADYSGIESDLSNTVSVFPLTGFSGGDGTSGNPYLVSNAGELFSVRLYPAAYYLQIADIDLGADPWNTAEGWSPIGNFGIQFSGVYDGGGYSISNLTINRPLEQAIGLFGSVNNSLIKNVNLNNASVTGQAYVGALVGDANNTRLVNISSSGSVTGDNTVGGIVGGLYYSQLHRSHSSGTVNATSTVGCWAGGIAGQNYSSGIYSSYSAAAITAAGWTAGGISGTNEEKSTIANSYFLGNVSGTDYIGGIAGWQDLSQVDNCYSTGLVSGVTAFGGLIGGISANPGQITDSYWNTETSMQIVSQGGEGRSTDDMTYPYNTNTYAGWNFSDIWADDAGYTVNNGYPYLQMQSIDLPAVTTFTPDFITSTTAFVAANVTDNGGVPVTEKGICWSTLSNPNILDPHTSYGSAGVGPYSITITGLASETTYYVRAYATNTVGTSYGEQFTFTTTGLDPSSIVFSIIGGNAYLDNLGELPWWGTDGDDDIDLAYIGEIDGLSAYRINSLELFEKGEFKIRKDHLWAESFGYNQLTITGDPGNFYSFSEFSNIKTSLGKIYEITLYVDWVNNLYTLSLIPLSPTISTTSVTSVTSSSAMSGGEVISEGINPVVMSGVCWDTNPNPSLANYLTNDASGLGIFTSSLTGLAPYTMYYYRAYAKTITGGVFYGEEYSFVSLNNDASVTSLHYNVDQNTQVISNVPLTETLPLLKANLFPSAGATFEVYQGDGTTVATDLQTGYLVNVTAQDGSVKTYSIDVNDVLSAEANILTYSIASVTATVNSSDKTVAATLAYGTDVTNLASSFTISGGASVSVSGITQVSDVTTNDFTNPVVYDVTAEDATTVLNWIVTISVAPASSDATVSSNTYTIDNSVETITNVPGTESLSTFKSNLIPAPGAVFEVYESDNLTVAADLQTGYKVTVTAQDGSTTKTYTITLNAIGSNLANFSAFKLAGKNGIINSLSQTISVNLPYGTDVTNLASLFIISDGASAKVAGTAQTSGVTMNDFTNPVVYEVTAENGTNVVNWTVNVIIAAPSSVANISAVAYTVIEATGIITNVPEMVGLADFKSNLTASAGATFEVYQSDGSTIAGDVQNGYKVIVTAQDGVTQKTYTIVNNKAEMITFAVAGVDANINNATLSVAASLPYASDVTNLVATYSLSSGATASIAGNNQVSGVSSNDFTNPVVYNVTAEDGVTEKSWTVTISVIPGSSDASLSSLVYTVDNSAKTITNVSLTESLGNFISKITPAANASFDVYENDEVTSATNLQTGHKVIVTAQDGTTAVYTITLNSALSSEADFITFKVAGEDASINTGNKTVTTTLPYGTNVTNLSAIFSISVGASVDIGGTTQVSGVTTYDFSNPVVYNITAEDGTVVSWTVTISVTLPSNIATVSSTVYEVDNSAGTISNVPVTETLVAFKTKITPAPDASFEVYESDGSTTASDLQSGYKLIATAQDGSTTKTYTIEINAAGIAGTNTSICSGGTASLTLTDYTGTIQWQQSDDGIIWNNVTGGTGAITENYTTANLTSTTYFRAEVTDSPSPPLYSNVVTVSINQVPVPGDISGNTAVCSGQTSVTYSIDAIGNATSYVWTLPTGATGTSTTNSIDVNFSVSFVTGIIEVYGQNACGSGDPNIIIVSVNPFTGNAGAIAGTTTVCQGQTSVIYTVPVIANATSYIWTLPAGATGTSTTNTITVDYGALAASGNVTVKGTNLCGDGTASNLSVLVNQLPANPGTISGAATVCQGVNSKSYAVPSVARATSYSWTLPDGATGSSSTNIITVNYGTSAVSGNIVLQGVNACGAGPARTLAITVNELPVSAEKIEGPETICEGQTTAAYTVPAIENATSYVWTLPVGVTGTSTTNTINVSFSPAFTAGGIEVYGQNSCGTGDASIVAVSVFPVPDKPVITPSGPTAFCSGGSVILSAPVSASYLWSTGETTSTITVNSSGNYTVQVSNGNCQSIASDAAAVTVNALPSQPVITPSGATAFCAGGSVNLSAPSSTSYLWSTGEITQSITINSSGSYTVQVSDINCQSISSEPVNITVNPFPANAQSIAGNTAVCSVPASETYTVPAIADATSYVWTLPSGANGISATNSIDVSFDGSFTSGNISVKGNNSCGDASESTILVVLSPAPVVAGTISGPASVCPEQVSVTYTVPVIDDATSYVWTLPAGVTGSSTTNSITVDFGAAYVPDGISVFGQNACSSGGSSTIAVSVNPLPGDAGAITGETVVCQGQTTLTYTVPVIANASSYEWTLPTGSTGTSSTNSITVDYGLSAGSGNISVKGSNTCGFGNSSSLSVNVNPLPASAGSITDPGNVCQGLSNVAYTATTIPNADTYIWTLPSGATGSSSTRFINVNYGTSAVSGDITWSGHNSCGDGAAGTLQVIVNPLPVSAGTISGEAVICEGQTSVIYSVPAITHATSYEWTLPDGASGSSITNTISVSFASTFVPGTILVNGLNDCGIGASSTLGVSEMAKPLAAGAITGPAAACVGENSVTYTVPVIVNASSYVWTLPTGVSGSSTTNSIDIDFSSAFDVDAIEVYGMNSCYDGIASSITIKSNSIPADAGAITGLTTVCLNQNSVVYNVSTIANATEYVWTLPDGATGTLSSGGKINTVNYGPTSISGTISVKGRNSCDGAASSIDIDVIQPFQEEQVCIITIDEETGKNMIVWEKTADANIASYNVYREASNGLSYTVLKNISVDSLSVYVDMTSDPETKSQKYYITAIDNCGNESEPSNWHRPMLLTSSLGTTEATVNLNWAEYETQSGVSTNLLFTSYIIYRDTELNMLTPIDTIPLDNHLYIDRNAPVGVDLHYRIAGIKLDPCDPANILGKKASSGPFVHSLSNLEDNRLQGTGFVNPIANALQIAVYPSPFIQETTISYTLESPSKIKVEVFNTVGEKIKVLIDENQASGFHKVMMNASDVNYFPGVYYLKIYVDDDVIIRKTMLTR